MDGKKVIKGLEGMIDYLFDIYRNDTDSYKCAKAQEYSDCAIDAIALLKEQRPKTGHWLKKMSNYPSAIAMGGSRTSACDLCGGWGRKTFKYCPHCGAKMEEPTRT